MVVVSNKSPLIIFGRAGRLNRFELIPLVGPILEELRSLRLYLNATASREALVLAGEPPAPETEAE